MTEFQGVDVGCDKLLLALELVTHQGGEYRKIDIQQRRQGAHVNHVLEQLALARVGVLAVADCRQRYTDNVYIVA